MRVTFALLMIGGLAACAPTLNTTEFETTARAAIANSENWGFGGVEVVIPKGMGVANNPSELLPSAELINWWGDPPGDRKKQVGILLRDAATAGARDALSGRKHMLLRLKVNQFHAVTPRTRKMETKLGVHTVNFDLSLIDRSTGTIVAEQKNVAADLRAYSGSDAAQSEARGETQKSRIQARVTDVVRRWLQR